MVVLFVSDCLLLFGLVVGFFEENIVYRVIVVAYHLYFILSPENRLELKFMA